MSRYRSIVGPAAPVVLVVSSLALAFLVPVASRAQMPTDGPNVMKAASGIITVGVEFDSATTVEFRTWKADEAEARALRQTLPANKTQQAPLPPDAAYFRFVILDAAGTERGRTPRYSVAALLRIKDLVTRATIGEPSVSNGDELTVSVHAVGVNKATVRWTPPGGRGEQTKTFALQDGDNTLVVDLQHPAGRPAASVTVYIEAGDGATKKADVATTSVIAPTVGFGGGGAVKATGPTTITATIPVTVTPDGTPVAYRFLLTDALGFTKEVPGTCTAPMCTVSVSGLPPDTPYKFAFSVGPTAGNPAGWQTFVDGPTNYAVRTLAVPKRTGAAALVLTKTGVRVTVNTDRPTLAELVVDVPRSLVSTGTLSLASPEPGKNLPIPSRHVFEVPESLAFTVVNDSVRSTLLVRLRDPETKVQIDSLPLVFGSDFAKVAATTDLKKTKIVDAVKTYGPVMAKVLGVALPLIP